jgi:general stress protein CsbA
MDSPFPVLVLFALVYGGLTLCLVSIAASVLKQFSLKSLMIAVTVVSIMLGLAVFVLRK